MTRFIRLLEVPLDMKAVALKEATRGATRNEFIVDPENFSKVPGSPFAYWVGDRIRQLFERMTPFETEGRNAKGGMKTQSDERFLRLYWEVEANNQDWVPLCKGGRFSQFYSDVHLVTDWWMDGKRPRAAYEQKAAGEAWGGFGRNESFYFRPGLTWPRRTNGLSFRVMPSGCIFADKGPAVFVEADDVNLLLALCALMNSKPFAYLVNVQLARTELAQSFEVGLIQQTPIPDISPEDQATLANLARRAWSIMRSLDATSEQSHAFVLPEVLLSRIRDFSKSKLNEELLKIQAEIDDIAYRIYGLSGSDRASIETSGRGKPTQEIEDESSDDKKGDEDDNTEEASEAEGLISWSVGVAFGRFDIRVATGARKLPPEPRPFDLLPAKSPGMVPEQDAHCHGILVDDLGHPDDLATKTVQVYETLAESLPDVPTLRKFLARDFFSSHVKMYSRSRRKAPIYWQLSTVSTTYSVWLYTHEFSKDTLLKVQNDYVGPKLAHEQRRLDELRAEVQSIPGNAPYGPTFAQEAFVEELRAFLDEIRRVSPLWSPNPDDGVMINFASLWRLVPQNKSWQRELKSKWDQLVSGGLDWSHLAMRLWPERVVPKCAADRSLAIAHGLENNFWFEDEDGKWRSLEKPAKSIDALIRERTSTAVKAALKSLLEAPDTVGPAKRARKSRAA